MQKSDAEAICRMIENALIATYRRNGVALSSEAHDIISDVQTQLRQAADHLSLLIHGWEQGTTMAKRVQEDRYADLHPDGQGWGPGVNGPPPASTEPEDGAVNHPKHYTSHPSGVEAIKVTRALPFSLGNCLKYLLRHKHKGKPREDLKKALWYAVDASQHDDPGIFDWNLDITSICDHEQGDLRSALRAIQMIHDDPSSMQAELAYGLLIECIHSMLEAPHASL